MSTSDPSAVSPILKKIIEGVINNTVDEVDEEEALCAAWELSTTKDYAKAINDTHFHRVLIKVATMTKRHRPRELAMGILANLANHWDCGVGPCLLNDMDILKLCRLTLWNENTESILSETTRLLNTFLSCSIDANHQTVIEHANLTLFLTPVDNMPSICHQYTLIICNTLSSELLLRSLELMTRIVVYTNAITHSISRRKEWSKENQYLFMNKTDSINLIFWGTQRLEEEIKGVGLGIDISKNVMRLLWALMACDMVNISDCEPSMIQGLGQSMSRLITSIQDDDIDTKIEDEDIQNLALALNTKLSLAS